MKINHTIKILIISDFLMNSGFSFFAPIFAIFITKQIDGGTLATVGFASAITQIIKSTFQIPIARWLDKNHGEFDDFYALIIGTSFFVLVPFLYMFASTVPQLYMIQAVYGLGLALAVPPWYAIFTRHIDKLQANMEWSFESVGIGISGAVAATLGGLMAQKFGFRVVFLIGGTFALVSAMTLIRIFSDLKGKVARGMVKPMPNKEA